MLRGMLYRFRPTGASDWIDSIGRSDFALIDQYNGDLDKLEWQPAERMLDEDTLRLALRHGRPSRFGIVVDPIDLVPLDHLRRIVQSHADLVAVRPEYRATLAKMEVVFPGQLDEEEREHQELDAVIADSIKRSRAELDEALKAQPIDSLVAHWLAVGGTLPSPV